MAHSSLNAGGVVTLPNTLDDLKLYLAESHTSSDSSSPARTLVNKYSIHAVNIRRLPDTAVIFVTGPSGSGKSTTINTLFKVNLCKTSSTESPTHKICFIEKCLRVPEKLPIKGKLAIIDNPGSLDSDEQKQNHLKNFTKFHHEKFKLAGELPDGWGQPLEAEKLCYPNVVLFIISAKDQHMNAPSHCLEKALKFVHMAGVVDPKENNVIVVLTHAVDLGRKKKRFKENFAAQVKAIRAQVTKHLKIKNVEVIPVENDAKNKGLKETNGFYKLPDGQKSHLNLLTIIKEQIKQNNDTLADLLISYYFSENCCEKIDRACIEHFDLDFESELESCTTETYEKNRKCPRQVFELLGMGFCPITERDTICPFILDGPTVPSKIEKSKMFIPTTVDEHVRNHTDSSRETFLSKLEYERHKLIKYGLKGKLNVQCDSDGKWIKDSNLTREKSCLKFLYEIKLSRNRLKDYNELKLSQQFQRDLKNLPERENYDHHRHFFSKWGTHFINAVSVGGSLEINCFLSTTEIEQKTLLNLELDFASIIDSLFNNGLTTEYENKLKRIKRLGVSIENVKIKGGNPPGQISLENPDAEVIKKWSETVYEKPTELMSSIEIVPYYNLLNFGEKNSCLLKATEKYLTNNFDIEATESTTSFRKFLSAVRITFLPCIPLKTKRPNIKK